jgi:hypothetical protein
MAKNKNQNPHIHWAVKNQRTKTTVIVLTLILIALFSPILMGKFPTKGAGTKLPGIWYNSRTGHYMADVAALRYTGILDDGDTPLIDESVWENGIYRSAGDANYPPDVITPPETVPYSGCSSVFKTLPSDGYYICDVVSDNYGGAEPVDLVTLNTGSDLTSGLGIDGTENIDAIAMVSYDGGSGVYTRRTMFAAHSNVAGILLYLSTTLPFSANTVVSDVIPSVFVATGAGNDYNVFDTGALPAGVTLWGGDGINGVRDDTPPSAINISTASTGSDNGKVNLTWTATGDDGAIGTAYSYLIRYSGSSINAGNFDTSTLYTQAIAPAVSGQIETVTVSGLSPGTTYYFSVKACDEYKTCGAFGNTISAASSLVPPAYNIPDPGSIDVAPTPALLINDGANTTYNNLVKLTINNPGIFSYQMRVSNFSDFRDSDYFPLNNFSSELPSWDLCKGRDACENGIKTVYVDLYDQTMQSSGSFSSTIELSSPTTILINDDGTGKSSLSTASQTVTLSISNLNSNASFLKISNLADLSDADFQPYSSTVSGWDLCKGITCSNGTKNVYVQLYNANKLSISGIILTTINLNIPVEEKKEEEKKEEVKEEIINIPVTDNTPTGQTPTTPGITTPTEPEPILPQPEPVIPEPTPTPTPIEPTKLRVTIQKIDEIVTSVGTPIVSTVLVATVALSFVTVASSFVDLLAILRHLITLLLQFLGIKRKNKDWGVVYDSATKEPLQLCIVRLFDSKTNALTQTAVTDAKGRFGLVTVSGQYYITVTKPIFSFPSKHLKGISYDIGYSSLYFGEKKSISGKNIINFAIPLDKPNLRRIAAKRLIAIRSLLVSLSTPIAILGTLLSLVVLYINPTLANLIIFVVYIFFLLLKKLFLSPPKKPYVKIIDHQKKKPMPNLAIEVFGKKYKKLVATKISDKNGKFDLFLPDGEYFFKSTDKRYDFITNKKLKNSYDGGTLVVNDDNRFSELNIYLKKVK